MDSLGITSRIDYSRLIRFLQSDEYIDKTDCLEELISHRFTTLSNCKGTGSSLLMMTLACFLDETANSGEVFQKLKIGNSELFAGHINSYAVLWLDFSDFIATSMEQALEYIMDKMSAAYRTMFRYCAQEEVRSYNVDIFDEDLEIIGKTASDRGLERSLYGLLYQLRYHSSQASHRKVAVLIDNIIQLETIAIEYGYDAEMRHFLETYLVEDIYKYCDIFFQIGDIENPGIFGRPYMSYYYFSIHPLDIKERYPEMTVPRGNFPRSRYAPSFVDDVDWGKHIKQARQIFQRVREEEERRRQEYAKQEKERYASPLSEKVPGFSSNLGIREKYLDKQSAGYVYLNGYLRQIYEKARPQFRSNDIYKYFQRWKDERVIKDTDAFKQSIETLSEGLDKWNRPDTKGSSGNWVQSVFSLQGEDWRGMPNCPENLKIYICLRNHDVQKVFTSSLAYLLQNAKASFAAKIAVYNRSDQICYWISAEDFKHLEAFYKPYFPDMEKALPFVAYKGKLGISREFPGIDESHNSMQAHIMADYFKTLGESDEVDLEDMYNNYIAKWNADIVEESDYCGFKNNSALSFMVILETLDILLSQKDIPEDSFLLSGDSRLWQILAESRCWADVNENWDKTTARRG